MRLLVLALAVLVLCSWAPAFGAITFNSTMSGGNGYLTYGAVTDLTDTTIDPAGGSSVSASYGNVTLSQFNALAGKQVIGFNSAATGSGNNITEVHVQATDTDMVNFMFPYTSTTVINTYKFDPAYGQRSYQYGGNISRPAFSGPQLYSNISTSARQNADDLKWDAFGMQISTTAGQPGVQALGFCMIPASAWTTGKKILFTMSDGSTCTITLPTLSGSTGYFIGYQADPGLTIARVQAGRAAAQADVPVLGVDDIAFVLAPAPEPATLTLLALGGLMFVRRRHA